MDNAQKAIMIGVGLFITIIIISAVLLITTTGTNLINNAQSQVSGISSALQQQVTSSYDGKQMTGNDVISAVQLYQNSNDISVRIVVTKDKQFQTGKYAVKLMDTSAASYQSAVAGGKKVTYTGNTSYAELKTSDKSSLSAIQGVGGVSGTQTYYSYVMRDDASDQVIGVLFVRRGISATETLNDTVANS